MGSRRASRLTKRIEAPDVLFVLRTHPGLDALFVASMRFVNGFSNPLNSVTNWARYSLLRRGLMRMVNELSMLALSGT
jgi:hypothetical protein